MTPELPMDAFFRKVEERGDSLTFDDIRIKTGYSEVERDHINLSTKFSRNIPLLIPIVSAAMDTVTEYEMAIELAKIGGIGVIHRGLTPKKQAFHVARAKYHLTGRLIERPITMRDDQTIESILKRREEKKYPFHSFPIVDTEGRLVGLLTRNDFDMCDDPSRLASEVMTPKPITAPPDVTLEDAYSIMRQHKKKILPLVDGGQRLVGMFVFSDVARVKSGSSSTYNVDAQGRLRVAAAIGDGEAELERAEVLVQKQVDVLVIDKAHADTKSVISTLTELKRRYPQVDVVVGNISEPESAKRLAQAGADGLKIGQGPGSICTTQVVTGIGCPQVTAVYNCARAVRGLGIPVCADGGIRHSGDIVKALAVGADSVMLGRLLAGTKETPGEVSTYRGKQVKDYRGMGSMGAMEKNLASRERYSQAGLSIDDVVPEGIEGVVPYQGELAKALKQRLGGLRGGMHYVGAASVDELHLKADFRRPTTSGMVEAHPHDVEITKDAPNYPRG